MLEYTQQEKKKQEYEQRMRQEKEFYYRQYAGQSGLSSQFIYGNGDDK